MTEKKSTAWLIAAMFLGNALMLVGFYFISVGMTERVCEEMRNTHGKPCPAIMGLQPPTGEEQAESLLRTAE